MKLVHMSPEGPGAYEDTPAVPTKPGSSGESFVATIVVMFAHTQAIALPAAL